MARQSSRVRSKVRKVVKRIVKRVRRETPKPPVREVTAAEAFVRDCTALGQEFRGAIISDVESSLYKLRSRRNLYRQTLGTGYHDKTYLNATHQAIVAWAKGVLAGVTER